MDWANVTKICQMLFPPLPLTSMRCTKKISRPGRPLLLVLTKRSARRLGTECRRRS